MTNSIGGATIELAVDSSGVESGLDRVDGAVRRTGRTLDSLRTQGGGALDSIGAGGSAAANRVDAATRNIAGAVERANAALISGKKSGAEYFEELGRSRGADMMKLAPLIAQLRETESAQARAKAAIDATTASQQAAVETARVQAAALREVAAAQAGRDSYVAGLREQVALYGKSTEEVLRYKAAQAGAAEDAGPLILQLQNMRAAHEAIAESTRLEAQAQRQVAQAQANKDAFLATLREQAALHGKSAEEVLRYRAALAGAAAEAEPVIQAITRMKAAQEAATASAKAAADAQQAATQAQAKGDAFLAGLREQVALYGKSTEEVLRYKAAQAGAANAAEPQIQKLQQLKVAQEAVAEAARLAAAAQQQAAQVQANRDTLLAGLREQIALYGKSTEEVLRYRAAQAGAVGAAEPLIQELARLKIAQDAVTEAARLAAAAQQQAAQQQVAGTAMIASLREQIALYGKTTDEVLRYKAAQAGVAGAAEPHIQELQRLKLAEEAVTTAARAAAEAQRAAATAQTGRDSFVTGLQQQAAAIGKTRADLLELQAAQMGVTTQAAPFIAKLREVEQGLNHAGMSARATAAAMRGVPAQFTDIITSIQGGQAPLTVLLQQGGQLKDMFGGLGNAAKALGGYVLGLVNPYTIAAAAAAVLAIAFVQGRNEAIAYNKALILAGATATTTAGQLSDMARNISKGVGTQGAAAEAVLAMVTTGKVTAGNLEQFSAVAIKAQRALGQSVGDTAAQFADLGKAPVATLLKLDETFHFLTAGVYEQVKALELQGRTVEAGTAAQLIWAETLGSVSTKVTENLGSLQKAWKWVGDEAKGAWDSMLNIGREQTLEQQLATVQKRLTSSAGAASGKLPNGLTAGTETRSAAYASQRAADLELEASLKRQIALETAAIAPKEAANKLREAGKAWALENEKYLTRVQLRDQEITKTNIQGAALVASGTLKQSELDGRLGAIKLKYADTYNLAIDAQIELLKRRGVVEEESAKRSMSTLAADRSAGLTTSLLAEFKYAEDVAKLDQEALARKRALLVAELALTAAKPNSKKEQASLTGQIAEVDAQALTRTMQLKNDIATLDIKDTKQAMANLADLAVSRATDLQALQGQLQAQKDANAVIGLSAVEVTNFNKALTEEAAKRLENQADIIGGNEARAAEAATMRSSAAEIRALAEARAAGILKTEDFEQQKKLWESIDKTAHDTFVSIFDSGKSAFDRLRDTLKNGLLDLLHQMTVKRWIFNIGAEVSGYTGIAASAGSAVSGLGSLGSAGTLISGASAIKSGLGLVNGGLIGAGNSIGGLGSALGSTVIADFGAGLSGQAAAAAQAYGGTLSTAAGFGASINTAIAAVPGWGWAALGVAAIAGMSGLFSGGGPESNTRLQFASNNAVGNINNNERGESWAAPYIGNGSTSSLGTFGVRQTFWGDATGEVVQSFIKTVSQTDDALAAFMTSAEKASVTGYLAGKTYTANTGAEGSNPNANGELDKVFADRINNILTGVEPGLASLVAGFTGTSQALATEAAALLSYRAALKDSGEAVFGVRVTLQEIAALKLPTETTSAALARVTNEFTVTSQVAQMLGVDVAKAFGATGLASESARAQLILLSGGIQTFSAQSTAFAQTYLTDEERSRALVKQVGEQMAALGYASITTKGQFKELVLGLVSSGAVATEAGAKQYAALMNVSAGFATAADAAAAAITKAQEAAKVTAGLNGQIYDLTHTDAEALVRQRQLELAAMTATDAELQKRIYTLTDEKAAIALAAEASKTAAAAAIAKAQADASAAQKAYSDFGAAIASSMDAATNAAKAFRALNESLLVGSSSALSPEAKYAEAKRQFETADGSKLQAAGQAFLDASKQWFGGAAGYAADFSAVLARNSAAAAQNDATAAGMPAFWQAMLASGALGVNGSHENGLDFVPFDGYRAELHMGERVQTAASVRDGDAAAEETNALLREVLDQLRAANAQRGAGVTAQIETLGRVVSKLDDTKRVLAKATA